MLFKNFNSQKTRKSINTGDCFDIMEFHSIFAITNKRYRYENYIKAD